jgi:hypothetical protein
VTVNELLDEQVVLDIECLDRIYLSGFVNSLQTPGGVIWFLHEHRGMPISSRRSSPRSGIGSAGRWDRSRRPAISRWSGSKVTSARPR